MVLGFDNTGLLIAAAFAALVLKPHQLHALARNSGRVLGLAIGHLSKLRAEVANSKHRSQIVDIHNEMQESLSTLNSIRYQVRKGANIFEPHIQSTNPPPTQHPKQRKDASNKISETKQDLEQIPISAEMTGQTKRTGPVRYGSEIVLDAILEQKIAHQAQSFLQNEKSNH